MGSELGKGKEARGGDRPRLGGREGGRKHAVGREVMRGGAKGFRGKEERSDPESEGPFNPWGISIAPPDLGGQAGDGRDCCPLLCLQPHPGATKRQLDLAALLHPLTAVAPGKAEHSPGPAPGAVQPASI